MANPPPPSSRPTAHPPSPPIYALQNQQMTTTVQLPSPVLQANPPPPSTFSIPLPSLRVTNEFDSDTSIFFHKVSCKFLDGLAKLKLTFQNDKKGEVSQPHLGFLSKNFNVLYDFEENNALINGFVDVGSRVQLKVAHDVKAQQGQVSMTANLGDPGYKIELLSPVPLNGYPRATLKFPLGEVSLEEREDEQERRLLSVNAMATKKLLDGICTARYDDETLKLRYSYKDEEVSFIPSISLPSNSLEFAFKRRFSPSHKMSYFYNFESNYWSTVYKNNISEDHKLKAGYDSEARLGWVSLWFGNEGGNAKSAPMKMKVQIMLQMPQDDIKSSLFMFRVKKRWDI